ncbi:dual specificity protein phosphatase family protein [Alginatibacterium sediminis]|uniref:dual specificity protein phosphatase family protein n=1 Tax=Alginatibacterium sediminis TaxID=2164068 RepID=UPI00131475C2|nr:dual specificity protein phosphatase family protein [Alginatibacterium sediminis]
MSQHPIYELTINSESSLFLGPCPGTKDVDLVTSLQDIIHRHCSAVISLITSEEMDKCSVQDLGPQSSTIGMQWFHLPIEDDTVPNAQTMQRFNEVLPRIKQLLAGSENVFIHCMGGSGRTGLIAALILKELGWSDDKAMDAIKHVRPNAFRQIEQQNFVKAYQPKT